MVAVAVSLGSLTVVPAQAGAIVAAQASPLSTMNSAEAERIFTGLQRTVDGRTIVVVFQNSGETREEFDAKVLGRTTAEVNAYMAAMIFTGRAKAPLEVDDDDRVKQVLASRPNAIGYINDVHVDDSVKVLFRY